MSYIKLRYVVQYGLSSIWTVWYSKDTVAITKLGTDKILSNLKTIRRKPCDGTEQLHDPSLKLIEKYASDVIMIGYQTF